MTPLPKKPAPLISQVKLDEMTNLAQKCFDYKFDGTSLFYEYDEKYLPKNYNIGLIVGNSGTGKTTLLRHLGEEVQYQWNDELAVISHFTDEQDALERLFSCGLNTIPDWVKPFRVLSNGQKYRANIAITLNDGVVYDEFTCNLDRATAYSLCVGIHRYIKQKNIRITCSTNCRDIVPFLQPDWVFDTNTGYLYEDGKLPVELPTEYGDFVGEFETRLGMIKVYKVRKELKKEVWSQFKSTHYLTEEVNYAAHFYVACHKGEMVAFNSALPQVGRQPNCWRGHRLVVKPEYQGMQIGSRLADFTGELYLAADKRYFAKSAHPKLGEYRSKSPLWRATSTNKKKLAVKEDKNYNGFKYDTDRICYSFEYIGKNPKPIQTLEKVEPKRFSVPLQKDGIIYLSKPLSLLTTKYVIKLPHIKRMIAGEQKKVKGFCLVDKDIRSVAEKLLENVDIGNIVELKVEELRK